MALARGTHFFEFTADNQNYIAINGDIFQHVASWNDTLYLIYNEKHPPKWNTDKPKFFVKAGNGFYWIGFSNYQTDSQAAQPTNLFVGVTTKGSYFKFLTWLGQRSNLDIPMRVRKAMAEEEERVQLRQPRLFPDLQLPSNVLHYGYRLWPLDADPTKSSSYIRTDQGVVWVNPKGDLGDKPNFKAHLGVRTKSYQAPPCIIEELVNTWNKAILPADQIPESSKTKAKTKIKPS
jgi:hypothetical protein